MVKKDHEVGTALQPRSKRGVHLGFSPVNSAWLVGTYSDGELHVYETRSATFIESVLVRNVEELNKPLPTLYEQLIDLPGVGTRNSSAVGAEKSVAGVGTEYGDQGLDEIRWEVPETGEKDCQISGHPLSIVPQAAFAKAGMKTRKRKATAAGSEDPDAAEDIDPGETSL